MVAIIDGDHMQYIIGSKFKDITEVSKDAEDQIEAMVYSLLETTCLTVGAAQYVLALSDPDRNYFRTELYKYRPYKGNRKDEGWFGYWRPYILKALHKFGGQHILQIEADDILCYLAEKYDTLGIEYVICSPDKDLAQIPGRHFDYSKVPSAENFQAENPIKTVTKEQANLFFFQQIIMGDSSDNIAGIPKMGEVKAIKFLKEIDEPIMYQSKISQLYCDTFGPYYGPIIFKETVLTVQLLNSLHPEFPKYQHLFLNLKETTFTGRKVEGAETLKELGWT